PLGGPAPHGPAKIARRLGEDAPCALQPEEPRVGPCDEARDGGLHSVCLGRSAGARRVGGGPARYFPRVIESGTSQAAPSRVARGGVAAVRDRISVLCKRTLCRVLTPHPGPLPV